MTKQEILDKLQKDNPGSIPTFKAMDEYAKQQAIAFDTWKRNNKWGDAMDNGIYLKPIGDLGAPFFKFEKASFDQLYNQFIEQQNKS